MESGVGLLWQPMAPSTELSRHMSLMDICPVGKADMAMILPWLTEVRQGIMIQLDPAIF